MTGLPTAVADLVTAELRAAHIPGGAVAVADHAGLRWAAGFGLADVRAGRPATPETAHHLYSGTKLYTAVAVLKLAEQQRVALDGPAAEHLPDVLGAPHLSAACRPTVRQLLSHTSGLRDTLRAFLAVHAVGAPAPSTAEALARYRIACERAPGGRVAYRNVNYALLGEIVSRVARRPYTDYVVEEVLEPLGVAAAFTTTPAMRANVAVGYVGAWDPMRLLAPLLVSRGRELFGARVGGLVEVRPSDLDTAAVGGLVGSPVGFAPFLVAQLADGGGVLGASSVRAMQALVARGAAGIASRVGMGLGWKIGSAGGEPFLNHEGGGPGFTSETRLYPARGLGIVLCLNRWIPPAKSHLVAHRICEAIRRAR
jgi:CubicO group peptidase (beta-lactamase class C family)